MSEIVESMDLELSARSHETASTPGRAQAMILLVARFLDRIVRIVSIRRRGMPQPLVRMSLVTRPRGETRDWTSLLRQWALQRLIPDEALAGPASLAPDNRDIWPTLPRVPELARAGDQIRVPVAWVLALDRAYSCTAWDRTGAARSVWC